MRRSSQLAVLVLAAALPATAGEPLPRFEDASAAWQIGAHVPELGHGTGAAAADYDGDGRVDLFVPQRGGVPDRLYHNLGTTFEEVAAEVGLASTASSRVALWLDYDGDHDLDLWVANDDPAAPSSFTLYRQQAGLFEDVTVEAGVFTPHLPELQHWSGICAADLDHDGFLDVFTGQWPGPGHLFMNTGVGGFLDRSAESGVASVSGHAHGCGMEDFDGDGWIDIYVAIDFAPNLLWVNQRDGTFLEQAPAFGLANAMNDMGMALGDYDDDGDFDVYVTNVFLPDHPDGPRYNVLFRNDGPGANPPFVEVAQTMGVDHGFFGWGATFLDADQDGDLDLAATNGWRSGEFESDPSRFFVNPGDGGPFLERSTEVGFDDTGWGSALMAADLDRDGDLELVQACMPNDPLRVLENQTKALGHYLVVQPLQGGGNRFAVGARVVVEAGGRSMLRRISAGTSYLGQEPPEAHFGLGAASVAERVTVVWPDGLVSERSGVGADQVLVIDRVFGDGFESGDVSAWSTVVAGGALP